MRVSEDDPHHDDECGMTVAAGFPVSGEETTMLRKKKFFLFFMPKVMHVCRQPEEQRTSMQMLCSTHTHRSIGGEDIYYGSSIDSGGGRRLTR